MLFRIFIFILLGLSSLYAQQGDKKDSPDEEQLDRVPVEKIPPAPPLAPADALKSFKLQPGFRIELVAAEPLVRDPVTMAFDADGRIWVAEMTGYMRDYAATGERDPVGSIVVLEDVDADGKMDKRTVFLDKLTMPRAVLPVRDGVLIGEPPNLWFCRDTNADLKCDEKILVLNDYGDTHNPEHTANGLMWAMDNWIYSANWITRLRSLPREWKRDPTTYRGQWGLSQDDYGRLVYNSNSDQFRMDLVPSRYLQRNLNFRNPAGLNVDPIRDQTVYPVRVNPGVNRGYREGTLRPDGTLSKFTAACSPLIYRGENFPREFQGNAFVCEPSANLIKRNVLIETNGELHGWQAYTNAEFLASTDERFRPVHLGNAPDGALYIVDMYRGVIQHKIFLTSYLRRQSESRGLEKPIEMGRIYRVVHEDKKIQVPLKLSQISVTGLVEQLSSSNGWIRDTAQRLLVERHDSSATAPLKKIAMTSTNPLARIHALWTLDGVGGLDFRTLAACYEWPRRPQVRVAAIRLSEPFLKGENKNNYIFGMLPLQSDRSLDVQLQLALTLGEITDSTAEMLMNRTARLYSGNSYIRDALLSGLRGRELEMLQQIEKQMDWENLLNGNENYLSGLAECIFVEANPQRVSRLFEIAAAARPAHRVALLKGIAGLAPVSKKSTEKIKPVRFDGQPESWKKLKAISEPETTALLEQVARLITWPGHAGYAAPKVARPLTDEQKKRFETGKQLYGMVCAGCHQLTGQGMDGLAPPLADSEWVTGSDRRLSRIIFHGVKGPISVKGKTYEMEMPGLPFFDDEQIAAVLTYIRREWGHTAKPVSPDSVKKVREETATRMEAWSAEELLKVK